MIKGKLGWIGYRRLVVALLFTALAACAGGVSSASAAAPWWRLSSGSWPAVLPAQGEGTIVAVAENGGDGSASGTEVVMKDKLPPGATVQSVSFFSSAIVAGKADLGFWCGSTASEVMCAFPAYALAVTPYGTLEMRINVKLEGVAAGAQNEVSVSGGEAAARSLSRPLDIGGASTPFGVEDYEMTPEYEGGGVVTQAGSHPFQLSTTLVLNQTDNLEDPPAFAKDLRFELPAGLIGNPTPFPQCSQLEFAAQASGGVDLCPNNTAVGVAVITYEFGGGEGGVPSPSTFAVPLFNLKPSVGEPARFGFSIQGTLNVLDTSVRTGGGYNVVVEDKNITQVVNFMAARVTFWGVPGEPAHDTSRGWSCIANEEHKAQIEEGVIPPCNPLSQKKPPPLLTMPTSCTGPLKTNVVGDSWTDKGAFTAPFEDLGPSLDGCNRLPFAASIGVAPDSQAASTASGLTVGVQVPQAAALNAEGLSPADVKDTTVALPTDVALNPAAADGLQACTDIAEPGRPEGEIGLNNPDRPSCPDAAKVGTLEIKTPLLPNPLVGAAYLAAQNQNPFGSLVALYLVAEDPVSGVLVKLAGEVKPDPVTGQLVSTFKGTPQLPFEDLNLHFFGGSRAPLSTPGTCGSYTTTASFTPWSGNDPVDSSSEFQILTGPNAGPCGDPLPFAPSLAAGTTSIQAGGFSPFTMTMSRDDGNQNLKAIELHMPPGMSGTLTNVKLCGEAQANAGTCGPESEIGETIVSVGVGGDPFSVKGGKVFITGPYRSAPFGLSIVNPAKAGPFDLGQVVVRAKVEVNPITSALTITSDSAGPYKIPTILDGIPLQIKHVNVTVKRPHFTFNPTNCSPLAITGKLLSAEGSSSDLSVPFQVTNCAVLAFKPKLTAKTSGKTSRTKGASLTVNLTYPAGPFDANVAKVKVDLPKQLPSRLTTLQKACPSATFEANPASCPAGSIIGAAKATTPVLPVPLAGPAYFVSYGGAKFPELVIVLSGYGVTVQLHGETFISKAGITSSTFKTIPDVPVGTFELILPNGPNSALAANGNLCSQKLAMPTIFVGQNGASIHTATPIAPTGCKPAITILHHTVKNDKINIAARVPSAGILTATATGLSTVRKRAGAAGVVSLTMTLSRQQRQVLGKHPARKLNVAIKLLFTPLHGHTLTGSVRVLIG